MHYSLFEVRRRFVPVFAMSVCLLAAVANFATAADPFLEGVRSTPWLSPEDEQKQFKLPEGFEINLVAAEPAIQKPLNMAFDERGRIWLTDSVEYPYPVPLDQPGRDSIKILEDTDGDGRFEKVTTFVDGLNIPIGIYPWKGGCIAYSIPNIWHFEDTDGDGKCDKRTKLYGPFDYSRDTHGMVNSFRRGFDGWLYACHGFNNDSRVKGADGHEIHLQSGNTFRFRLDGSRIEHFTHGQVNPFGMCFDELFNIFTADCHSKPISQLIRGGHYPSFGKPHDGLGFVPPMMDHLHGSTAICGLTTYTGENFPPEYRGQFFSGNVMTSRINRNKPIYHGSTIKAEEQPDFLIAGDPWFRPVDIHIGPDGAMYVLDFYNRIIGHYEVPLTHPGRDRTSGRIWRIAYTGKAEGTKPAKMRVFGEKELRDLFWTGQPFEEGPLPWRLMIMNAVSDNTDTPGGNSLRGVLNMGWPNFNQTDDPTAKALWLWLFDNVCGGDDDLIADCLKHKSPAIRAHLMKTLAERDKGRWHEIDQSAAETGLKDPNAFVVRAAADALGRHPSSSNIRPLMSALIATPADDALLRQTLRMALRDNLATMKSLAEIEKQLQEAEIERLADIALALPTPLAAELIIKHLETRDEPRERLVTYLQHAARYVPEDRTESLVNFIRTKFATNLELQASLLESIQTGLAQRGIAADTSLASWGTDIATKLLSTDADETIPWTPIPIEGLPPSENPWVVQQRASSDGDKDSLFFSSLPKGEQRTGIYRSGAFPLPAKLSFWCAGHSGFAGGPLNDKNYIRLRDAEMGELLAESRPTRNDTAQRIEWDLTKFAGEEGRPSPRPSPKGRGGKTGEPAAEGRLGYIELVDADTATGYAWLAVGRFSLSVLNPSDTSKRQIAAAEIVGRLKLTALRPHMATLLANPKADPAARSAAGQALVALDPDSRAAALVAAMNEPALLTINRTRMAYAITVRADQEFTDNLREVMKAAPSRLQTSLAEILAGDLQGATTLVELVKSGNAAASLLIAPSVATKLAALNDESLNSQIKELTAKLPPTSELVDKLIAERKVSFASAKPNLARGQEIFTKNCAACHQIAGKGAIVGPQLDGIGNRGLERLLEDTLDPNRNVDVAFRTTTFVLADGRILTGLVRREEGSLLVLADNKGKEFTLPKTDIDQQQKTPLSLMPSNVAETLPSEELQDLLGYLLSERGKSNGE